MIRSMALLPVCRWCGENGDDWLEVMGLDTYLPMCCGKIFARDQDLIFYHATKTKQGLQRKHSLANLDIFVPPLTDYTTLAIILCFDPI